MRAALCEVTKPANIIPDIKTPDWLSGVSSVIMANSTRGLIHTPYPDRKVHLPGLPAQVECLASDAREINIQFLQYSIAGIRPFAKRLITPASLC